MSRFPRRSATPSRAGGPSLADALCNDALMLHEQGRYAEAIATFDRALAMRPRDPVALNNRGVALNALGRHAESIASYDKALALESEYVFAHYNRGRALEELERYVEAVACYDKVLALDPRHAVAHNNRGTALDALGRHGEAVESFARALAIRPDYPEALNNRGTALASLAQPNEALASYDAALALDPDYVECLWNKALVQLRQGAFAQGWAGYEARRRKDDWEQRKLPGPEWDGNGAPGKRLFLYAEQGLGDTIQFSQLARPLVAEGMHVVLEVQAMLTTLFQSLEGITVIGKGTPPPAFDCHLPLMSLPHVLGLTSVMGEGPYLAAEPERVVHWSRRLGREGFRVGIAWQGNPRAPGDPGRSIPLREFLPLARIPGVRLISLQRHDGLAQLRDLPAGLTVETLDETFDAGPDAFVDAAAVMMHLDLVITSDTSIAHLAGALGRPVWIALKHVPDWRFGCARDDWPWYRTARLFRQSRSGAWGDVFAWMAAELACLATPMLSEQRPDVEGSEAEARVR
jgi:Tfp pilus assembly protein PilF